MICLATTALNYVGCFKAEYRYTRSFIMKCVSYHYTITITIALILGKRSSSKDANKDKSVLNWDESVETLEKDHNHVIADYQDL